MSWAHCDYFHRRHLAIAFGIFCNHSCRPTRSPLSSARQQQGRGGVPVDSHNHILDDAQISIASSDHQAPGLPDPVSRETTPLSHNLSFGQRETTAFTEDATNEVKMLFNFSLRCRDEETRNVLFSCPIPKPSCARASMWRHPSSFRRRATSSAMTTALPEFLIRSSHPGYRQLQPRGCPIRPV